MNQEIVGIESLVEWYDIEMIKILLGKLKSFHLSFVQMGPFGLGLVIWNEEYRIWVVLNKRWILISILTIFGDSQFFTFFMTWRMTWRFGKRARDLPKRETWAISLWKIRLREGERLGCFYMPFWWKEGIALLLEMVLAYFE